MRITSNNITELAVGNYFVFGSNEGGFHGAGAAQIATSKFGAQIGIGYGHTGRSFAIPTKDKDLKVLPLSIIQMYVNMAYKEIKSSVSHYHITKIGCGLAGYNPEEIAPMFMDFMELPNVSLPIEFVTILIRLKATTPTIYEAFLNPATRAFGIGWDSMVGHGRLAIHQEVSGAIIIDHEHLSKESVKEILCAFVDKYYREAL